MAKEPAESNEPSTKTVRIDAELANQLGVISALSTAMGKPFRAVAFLNDLVRDAIQELHDETTQEHQRWLAAKDAEKQTPPRTPPAKKKP